MNTVSKPTQLLLIDDHAIIGEAVTHLFLKNDNFNFLGCFTDTSSVRDFLKITNVDIILLDISLPGESGIEFCKWIKQAYTDIKILFFSMHFDELVIGRAIKYGGDGYVTKNEKFEVILMAIKTILNGGYFYSNEIEQILLKRVKHPKNSDVPSLTDREKEVLTLLADGYSSKEIGNMIYLSNKTVDFHRSNLLLKFDAKNVVEVTSEAIRLGIID